MKKRIKRFVFFLGVAVLLVSGWFVLANGGNVAPTYRTATVTRGSIVEVVTATGTLNPVKLVNVGTQVSGQVSKVYVQVNDSVKEGQLLAEIDPALLEAQAKQDRASLATARANYEQAERDLNRSRMLLAKDYIAKVDVEHAEQAFLAAKYSYESAKTQIDRDEVNLNYARISSPIDGVVISQDVTLGQTVAASFQTPNMFKIAGDLTQMKIDVNLSEADIGKVKVGMPVTFTVDAFPDHNFTGEVQMVNVNPNNQQGVVTYTVIVTVANKEKLLLPGMTAFVSVTLSEKKNVLRVPTVALRFVPPPPSVSGLRRLLQAGARPNTIAKNGNAPTLYVLRNGAITPMSVNVGASDGSTIEVSGDGLGEGDNVAIASLPPGKR